jgi:hypothetical protein
MTTLLASTRQSIAVNASSAAIDGLTDEGDRLLSRARIPLAGLVPRPGRSCAGSAASAG